MTNITLNIQALINMYSYVVFFVDGECAMPCFLWRCMGVVCSLADAVFAKNKFAIKMIAI